MSKLSHALAGLLATAALLAPATAAAYSYTYQYDYSDTTQQVPYYQNTYVPYGANWGTYESNPYNPYGSYNYSTYPAEYQQQFQHYYAPDNYCGYYDGYYRCPTYSDYVRSRHGYDPVYPPVTDDADALPSYYREYLTPQPRAARVRNRLNTPAPKYYPPAVHIVLFDNQLHPQTTTVKIGTMVTWTTIDDGNHALQGDDFDFLTTLIGEGQEASYSFDKVGTYHYFDKLHPGIRGTIKVTR